MHNVKSPKRRHSAALAVASLAFTATVMLVVLGQIATETEENYRVLLVLVGYSPSEMASWRNPSVKYAAVLPFTAAGFHMELDYLEMADGEYEAVGGGAVIGSQRQLQGYHVSQHDAIFTAFAPTSGFAPDANSYGMVMPVEALLNVMAYDHQTPRVEAPSFAYVQVFWHELGHVAGLKHSAYYSDSDHCGRCDGEGNPTERCIMVECGGNNFHFCPACREKLANKAGGQDVHIAASPDEEALIWNLFYTVGESKASATFWRQPSSGYNLTSNAQVDAPPGPFAEVVHDTAEGLKSSPVLIFALVGLGLIVASSTMFGVGITLYHKAPRGKTYWLR